MCESGRSARRGPPPAMSGAHEHTGRADRRGQPDVGQLVAHDKRPRAVVAALLGLHDHAGPRLAAVAVHPQFVDHGPGRR